MKRWTALVGLVVLASGCADAVDRRPPVSALSRPRRSGEVISVINVREGDGAGAVSGMRDRAATAAADEVVDVGVERGSDGAVAHGMAVRYSDPIAGRPFYLVGAVEVSAYEGHEDEALDELRARALAIHADLIVDVRFHYGEGGDGPTSLSGIALRFRPRPTARFTLPPAQ